MKSGASGRPPGLRASFASPAFTFVFTMGIVNLFADTTYEGGASINGPFFALLGAGAAVTSIVAGFGEFLGYSIRLASGWWADRTGKYWPLTFVGYVVNLLAVPAMALAGSWPAAAALVLAERVGRAIRKPTVEAMLSYTTGTLGRGWVYSLNTALDETGATLGPIAMAVVLARGGTHRLGYGLLLVPALLTLVTLVVARRAFPVPSRLEEERTAPAGGFPRAYKVFLAGSSLFAAGLMSFELIGYHFAKTGTIAPRHIPLLLALSTAGGVVANLALGRLYDRVGVRVLLGAVLVTAFFSPLVFLGGAGAAVAGMMLWGIGYATQDTLFKAIIAGLLPEGRRSLAFGLFYAGYGVGWLVGSIVTGLLYERSLPALVAFSVGAFLLSIPIFVVAGRASGRRAGA
ncbi:MAG: MFS transporter [Syntrophomonadaceae bacterium]